jgi:hypothetical protein
MEFNLEKENENLVSIENKIFTLECEISILRDKIAESPEAKALTILEDKLLNSWEKRATVEKVMIEIPDQLNLKKIVINNGTEFSVKTTESVKLTHDISKVPQEFVRTKEIVTQELDKVAIKKWLKETGEIPTGTDIVYKDSLVVKRGV